MKTLVPCIVVLSLAAGQLGAQVKPAGSADHAVPTVREVWRPIAVYIAQAAEDMPADKYSFRPTPDVRTFGELIGHLAGSQYMFCAAAIGDSARKEDDIEKSKTTKADLVAAMKESTTYCEKAYTQSDGATRRELSMFGQTHNRLWALMSNAAHDDEHYGNIVTYLRMNGIVPPSSRPQRP
jgi:uncharacterized damage-inducible protein DinB